MLFPLVTFTLASIAVASRKIPGHWITLLGGSLLVLLGMLTPLQAVSSLNLETLGLLAGMLILVSILVQAGFFSWLAAAVVRRFNDRLALVFLGLLLLSALASMLMNSIAVILLLSAFSLQVCHLLKINPLPLMIAEACAANTPNAPLVSLVAGLLFLGLFYLLNRHVLAGAHRALGADLVVAIDEFHRAPLSARLNRVGLLAALTAMILLVFYRPFTTLTGLPFNAALAALIPAAIAMAAIPAAQRRQIQLRADAETILFFAGLFLMIGSLEKAGFFTMLNGALSRFTGASAALHMGPELAGALVVWSLTLGVDMAGSRAPIGAPLRWPAAWRPVAALRPLSGLFRLNAGNPN